MIRAVTFGYRWEGLALHQWAFTHTDLLSVVIPGNRLDDCVSGMIRDWVSWAKVSYLIQESFDSQFLIKQIREFNPDIILCHCYTYKLANEILSIPKYGCINIHPGKLPEYKGRMPIEDAFNKGDSELWSCIHYMNTGFDTGNVIMQVPVKKANDLQKMRSELTKVGLQLLEEKWSKLTK